MDRLKNKYLYETFKSTPSAFDHEFTEFLNEKSRIGWEYQDCFFCHDEKMSYAACIFKHD